MKKVKLLRSKRAQNPIDEYILTQVTQELMPLLIIAKMHEETEEIREALDDVEEYADLLCCLKSLALWTGINWNDIEAKEIEKAAECGRFTSPVAMIKE